MLYCRVAGAGGFRGVIVKTGPAKRPTRRPKQLAESEGGVLVERVAGGGQIVARLLGRSLAMRLRLLDSF